MSLSEIATVTITAETRFPTQRGFGTALIAGYHTAWVGHRVREYTDLDGLIDDGITAVHPIYRCAAKLLSQNPRVTSFKVGRRDLPPTQKMRIIPLATTAGLVYTLNFVTPAGVAKVATVTVQAGDAVADILDDLKVAIDALSMAVATVDNATSLDITANNAGELFDLVANRELSVEDTTADPTIATDLSAIASDDPEWYALLLDSNSANEIKPAASWCESRDYVLLCNSYDYEITDSGVSDDLFSALQTSGYARTMAVWAKGILSYAGAAWAGACLPFDPGSQTWAFKPLGGVTVSVHGELTDSQRSTIINKGGNYYFRLAGANATRIGQTPSGQFMDITRLIDLLGARIAERVYGLLLNNRKIPYTNAGVDMVRNEIMGVLQENVEAGGLAASPAPVVSAPDVADVADADKALRLLPDVLFTATLAGAIHKVVIQGKLVL